MKLNETANLSWTIVFIPIFGLLVLWMCIFTYVLMMAASNVFILNQQQAESVILYIIALIGVFVSLAIFVSFETSDQAAISSNAQIGTSVLLVSEILFFVGIVKSADATLNPSIPH